jgi:hypothetical protein
MANGRSIHLWVIQEANGGVELPNAKYDAEAMADVATSRAITTYSPFDNATSVEILQAIASVSQPLGKGDLLVVSFSGHGAFATVDGVRRSIWYGSDGNPVRDLDVYGAIANIADIRFVLIDENCRSDAAAHRELAEFFELEKRDGMLTMPNRSTESRFGTARASNALPVAAIVLAACTEGEVARATERNGENSLFTGALMTAWNGGAFAGSYSELLQVAAVAVTKENAHQHPQAVALGAGGISLLTDPAFQV